MPLPLLIGFVGFGLILIAVVVMRSFGTQAARLDRDRAIAGWLREFPDDPVSEALLSDDGYAVLVVTQRDAVGLVRVMGADTAAQILVTPPAIFDTGRELRLTLSDFNAPHLVVALADEADRDRWRNLLMNSGRRQ